MPDWNSRGNTSINLVGTKGESSVEAFEEILNTQCKNILVLVRDLLDDPLTLFELHQAAVAVTSNKVLGKDGTLVGFYLLVWKHMVNLVGNPKITYKRFSPSPTNGRNHYPPS